MNSRRLELSDSLLDRQAPPGSETLVITSRSAPPAGRRSLEERGLEVIESGEDDINGREALRILGARGMTAVLSEGEPRVLTQLQGHGLLDELCLSIADLPRRTQGRVVTQLVNFARSDPFAVGALARHDVGGFPHDGVHGALDFPAHAT